jgi:polygalacturonase
VVPAGEFLTGAIHLLSNVNLFVSEGATLRFTTDPAAYLPVVHTRWEGTECMNYSALIYAFEQENIAVTGSGTLDGQASDENWWAWAKRDARNRSPALADANALVASGDQGVPVAQRIYGAGHFLRPNFIQPYRCRNVLIEGVHIRRSPMWEINPVLCTNVIVRGLDISTHGMNNDGCDPDSSRDVLIENCTFDTGDDCIAIKSGRNDDGRRVGVAAENLIIRHCTMKDGHGGVVIGSEVAAGCRNVFVEDCVMDSPQLERVLRFKSNARRGGVMENIFARNLTVGSVAEAIITVDFLYEEGANGTHRPVLRNVNLEHVVAKSTPRLFYILGFEGATIDGIRMSHCQFSGLTAPELIEHAGRIELDDVTAEPKEKPRSLSSRAPGTL